MRVIQNISYRQYRRLIVFLIISLFCNFLWIGWEGYLLLRPWARAKPFGLGKGKSEGEWIIDSRNAAEVVHAFAQISLPQLISKLRHRELVEHGFRQRDYALALLIAIYHFDLARALKPSRFPLETRRFSWQTGEGEEFFLTLYPGMEEEQYEAVCEFAERERWPLTQEGLFLFLQQPSYSKEATLREAFFFSHAFRKVEMLFPKGGEGEVSRENLLTLLLQGDWTLLEESLREQEKEGDFSSEQRRRFLLRYMERGVAKAGELLLQHDFSFAVKKLSDGQVVRLLEGLDKGTPMEENFALAILRGPRRQEICEAAAAALYRFQGREVPRENLYGLAMHDFVGDAMGVKEVERAFMSERVGIEQRETIPQEVFYIVQEGDSLWKIATRNGVDVEALKRHNGMESDYIRPGARLLIP